MERIRSRTVFTRGGVTAVRGGGLLALAAVGLVACVGCTGSRTMSFKDVLPAGWVASKPATQITPAFNPQIQHLPDPTQDGTLRPGIVGQIFILAADGTFTDANGDLYVMAEDITPRPPGMPQQVMEVWHFDPVTLRKMRTKDERWGDCYALFLPYPPNWKDVTQIRVSTQYKPKSNDPTKEPPLSGPQQTVMLDFTPPGQQPGVWLKTGERTTSPAEIKAMPNVARDLARGAFGAPLTGPQPNTGTVPAGGVPPQPGTPNGGMMPAGGPVQTNYPPPPANTPAFTPPATGAFTPPAAATTPQLPPPMQFTADRTQATVRGPNGEPLNVTAVALPPGQTVPAGWTQQPDGSIQPPGTQPLQPAQPPQQRSWPQQPQQYQPSQQQPPPSSYQPASARFQPASERTQTQSQSRIQHGAFNQPSQHQTPLTQLANTPPAGVQQATGGQSAPLPPIPPPPPGMFPQNRNLPPVQTVPGGTPPLPTTASVIGGPTTPVQLPPVGGATAPAFDPNSPVGGWASQPHLPIQPPPAFGAGGVPTVIPPAVPDGPIVPVVLPR
jgi:hypothetical protein